MGTNYLRSTLLCMVLLTGNIFLFGQVEGESEVSSINLKKPDASGTGSDDAADRNITDITPPRITIISPQLDSTSSSHLSASDIYLIGRLTDDSGIQSLSINDKIITTDNNGFFQQSYTLEDGLNVFKIDASDILSNSQTQLCYLIKDASNVSIQSADDIDSPGDYFGLIIGIDNYQSSSLEDLDHPITDATLLYSTLIGNYMFEPGNLTLLKDPTRAEIITNLDRLSNQLTKNDNLLIFYAGHGHWDEEKETGYWLPADAEQFSSVNWIRNSTIQDFVDDINTRHTLLISDACFAGSIFKTRGAFQDASIAVNKLYSLSSRKAMTSGTMKQVPDRSVFIEYFMKRLLDNNKKYISSGELFSSFREAVLNNSPNIPQYGVIQDSGDEGGEFIFIKR
jgi:hypothetical protein